MTDAASSQVSRRVREALTTVYHTFNVPAPSIIEGCPCCISTRNTDVLLTTPLREITGQALWRYVSGVFLTIGDEKDFRYLLPRILEVSAFDPENANNPEIALGKLSLAGWRSWLPQEQRVIEQFVDAWFEQALASDLADADEGWVGEKAESVLCGAARAGMALDHWLIRLSAPAAAPVLADMQRRYPRELSSFWDYAPSGLQQLSTILIRGTA
ncbi:hypothetical protein [Sphingomonas sp. Leaf17]|uniref:hypothetical protein n=1 Tax=Sphingomonas sp. Leaf17 TaxID=1735683 RepID=UPI0012E2561A|nr:hypothetical protein [Sphingomonas sp. Leaf17]